MPIAKSGTPLPQTMLSVSKHETGLLETNILIHALTDDAHGSECKEFLRAVARGERSVLLTALVVHEFIYAISRYIKQFERTDIADYLIALISHTAVHLDDDFLLDAIVLWRETPQLGFVDAYLAVRGRADQLPVYTKNLKHFRDLHVELPNPLA